MIKDLETDRFSWIIQVGPMLFRGPYKREAGVLDSEEKMWQQKQRPGWCGRLLEARKGMETFSPSVSRKELCPADPF